MLIGFVIYKVHEDLWMSVAKIKRWLCDVWNVVWLQITFSPLQLIIFLYHKIFNQSLFNSLNGLSSTIFDVLFPISTEPNNEVLFSCSEALIRRTADKMVSEGYLAAGYTYVGIDDCWLEKDRDEDGRLVADAKRFPNGMKGIGDYVRIFTNIIKLKNICLNALISGSKWTILWCIVHLPRKANGRSTRLSN